MNRTVAAAEIGGQTIVYDPLTGQTRLADRPLPAGRRTYDDRELAGWPQIDPASLNSGWPVSLCWSPLVRCNLACPHCLDDKQLPELPAADRARTGQAIASSGVLGVDISGGEPLLLTDLPDLADLLVAGGLAVSVTTNGWQLARRAAALARHVDAVRVSLDGPDPDRHDAMRGRRSFDRALGGIVAARAAGLPVQIQTVIRASLTRRDLQCLVDLAARLGAQGVTFLQMLPLGEGAALTAELVGDAVARALVDSLAVPAGLAVRLRTRAAAGNFTVVRADGQVWRNQPDAAGIGPTDRLHGPTGLALTAPDGSA
ncbi:radical SAM protein [Pseudofrankia sp. DC12]|uniref:radical SAM protein n=1 Tax=Pseudofrankia sp. DC12 TaxID=683315 RepID=UPI0005F76B7B|nr:radical SAM protein [Pseudofrankia sp. DC12]